METLLALVIGIDIDKAAKSSEQPMHIHMSL